MVTVGSAWTAHVVPVALTNWIAWPVMVIGEGVGLCSSMKSLLNSAPELPPPP